MTLDNFVLAFGLTLFAGLSSGIGGLLALFFKRTNAKMLSVVLGLSAGVMIYVSMVEIFAEAQTQLVSILGLKKGMWVNTVAFFGGMLRIAVIDKLIPSYDNPHESPKIEEMSGSRPEAKNRKLLRTGIITAFAIAIHNFPEGIASFISTMSNPSIGIPIAVAIAIHNIPEGIAVSTPVYYATGSRKKALFLSFLAGLSEPVGALIGYLILLPFVTDVVSGITFASVAGIMVFISFDELLPSAREYGEHHLSILGLVIGMMIMALSLLLFI